MAEQGQAERLGGPCLVVKASNMSCATAHGAWQGHHGRMIVSKPVTFHAKSKFQILRVSRDGIIEGKRHNKNLCFVCFKKVMKAIFYSLKLLCILPFSEPIFL